MQLQLRFISCNIAICRFFDDTQRIQWHDNISSLVPTFDAVVALQSVRAASSFALAGSSPCGSWRPFVGKCTASLVVGARIFELGLEMSFESGWDLAVLRIGKVQYISIYVHPTDPNRTEELFIDINRFVSFEGDIHRYRGRF